MYNTWLSSEEHLRPCAIVTDTTQKSNANNQIATYFNIKFGDGDHDPLKDKVQEDMSGTALEEADLKGSYKRGNANCR